MLREAAPAAHLRLAMRGASQREARRGVVGASRRQTACCARVAVPVLAGHKGKVVDGGDESSEEDGGVREEQFWAVEVLFQGLAPEIQPDKPKFLYQHAMIAQPW